MEPVTSRPVSSPSQLPPSRQPEAAVAGTDLQVEATVQQSTDASEARDRDERPEGDQRRSAATDLASVRRRELESDAATGLMVMKVIEERSGDIVDQVPADAYLRMKIALKSMLDGDAQAPIARRA